MSVNSKDPDAKLKTILIVEDDGDGREVLIRIVESLGYRAVGFGSAQEALEGIKDQNIDLALIDIMMPGMNGYDLLKELRESDRFKELPIVMVTAKDEDNEMFEGYKYGADYYIPKPFTSKQIEWGIKTFLDE